MTGNPIKRHLVVPGTGSVWLTADGDRFLVTHRYSNGTPIHNRHAETRQQADAAWDDCISEIGASLRDILEHGGTPPGSPLGPAVWPRPDLSGFTDHDLVLAARAGILDDLRHWKPGYRVTDGDRQGWEIMAALSEVG